MAEISDAAISNDVEDGGVALDLVWGGELLVHGRTMGQPVPVVKDYLSLL